MSDAPPIRLTIEINPDQLRELKESITADVLAQVRAAELERLHTVDQVAAWLQVTPEWVRRHQKELGGYRLSNGGGRNPIRFRAATVERYLKRRQFKPPPASADDWALGANERLDG